jgi:hypothetical protein
MGLKTLAEMYHLLLQFKNGRRVIHMSGEVKNLFIPTSEAVSQHSYMQMQLVFTSIQNLKVDLWKHFELLEEIPDVNNKLHNNIPDQYHKNENI